MGSSRKKRFIGKLLQVKKCFFGRCENVNLQLKISFATLKNCDFGRRKDDAFLQAAKGAFT
jgi:hypothetical protein